MTECDMEEAIDKAKGFLEEYHSTTNLKSSNLENGTWSIIFDVGFLSEQLKEIKVDANSRKITEYTDIDSEDKD
ncbi:MAG: hypothetical protein R1F52_03470 [Candidatus Nitrosoabyssus spongiisocia]|nr:MAG: hypothetical protein R1F52_03470 [Nitrosopumilaceae archaeon AB1(1)]